MLQTRRCGWSTTRELGLRTASRTPRKDLGASSLVRRTSCSSMRDLKSVTKKLYRPPPSAGTVIGPQKSTPTCWKTRSGSPHGSCGMAFTRDLQTAHYSQKHNRSEASKVRPVAPARRIRSMQDSLR